MDKLQRSLSDRPVSVATLLELQLDFMDQDGVLRRSSSATKRAVLRGASESKLQSFSKPSPARKNAPALSISPENVAIDASPSESESVDLSLAREERMRRRTKLVLELRDQKHSLLMEQNDRHQERLQLWHDANEQDPTAETTSRHTALAPSPKSQTFVDDDGNLRRKSSSAFPVDGSGDANTSPGFGSELPTTPRIRTSLVWQFVQSVIEE